MHNICSIAGQASSNSDCGASCLSKTIHLEIGPNKVKWSQESMLLFAYTSSSCNFEKWTGLLIAACTASAFLRAGGSSSNRLLLSSGSLMAAWMASSAGPYVSECTGAGKLLEGLNQYAHRNLQTRSKSCDRNVLLVLQAARALCKQQAKLSIQRISHAGT